MPEPDACDAIPKVELHCHVEGAVRPATVVERADLERAIAAIDPPA
ncbi:MAG TPA: hypothetical protein VFM19_02720 [Candidatus Limnocylindria bacterium]|nr:hypothetical protein [Candidatus Limnocylindria bacterium]